MKKKTQNSHFFFFFYKITFRLSRLCNKATDHNRDPERSDYEPRSLNCYKKEHLYVGYCCKMCNQVPYNANSTILWYFESIRTVD